MMWIACAVALASLGCSEVVFPTLKASRVAGFVSSQLGELGSRTSQLVEQEKFEKLAMLRRSLTRRFAEYALDDSWRDDAGSCEIKMRTRSAGGTSLYIRVSGVGSKRVCRASLGALHKSFVDHDLSKRVTTFVDMSTAVACSPQGVQQCIDFVKLHGSSFDNVAVVAHGLSLQSVRFIVYMTRLKTVRVFNSWDNAYDWLDSQTRTGTPGLPSSSRNAGGSAWSRADELSRMRQQANAISSDRRSSSGSSSPAHSAPLLAPSVELAAGAPKTVTR